VTSAHASVTPITAKPLRQRKYLPWVVTMAGHTKDLLTALKAELTFIEKGGYRHTARAAWRPYFMFQDSPICLKFAPLGNPKPCSECALMQFVPENARTHKIPCRYIPLNEREETVDLFYRCGTQDELEAAVKNWLKTTIARLEREQTESAPRENAQDHPKTKAANNHAG
jgi:hypothetical protein